MSLENLEESKRAKIIQALIDEYAAKGYENASTNVIVKHAGISKGSLFNYFGNKLQQYIYVIEYSMNLLLVKLGEYMTEANLPDDYFGKLLFKSSMKVRMGLEYPNEYKLIFDAYFDKTPEVKEYMATQYAMFADQSLEQEKERLDPNELKNPEDRDRVVEMVFYLISGFSENYLRGRTDLNASETPEVLEDMTNQLESYFRLIEREFFKKRTFDNL